MAALVAFIGVEFCVTIWGADLVRSRTGVDAAAGAAAVSAFLLGYLAGRLGGARLALRFPPARLLVASTLVAAAGFLVVATASALPVAVAGLVVLGLGASVQFPLGAARAVELSGGRTDLASGRIGIAAGLASGAFPFLLGAVADQGGVEAAFLLVPVLLAAGAALVVAGARAAPARAQRSTT